MQSQERKRSGVHGSREFKDVMATKPIPPDLIARVSCLPEIIRKKIDGDSGVWTVEEQTTFSLSVLFPPEDKILEPSWIVLADALERRRGTNPDELLRRLRVFMVGETLLYASSQPADQKEMVLLFDGRDLGTQHFKLAIKLLEFETELQSFLIVDRSFSPEDLARVIVFLDRVQKRVATQDLLGFNPRRNLMTDLTASLFTGALGTSNAKLLTEGRLEEASASIRHVFWLVGFLAGEAHGLDHRAFLEYFVSHEDVRGVFWKEFFGSKVELDAGNRSIHSSEFFAVVDLLSFDSSLALRVLQTVPIGDFTPNERASFLRKLVAVCGTLQTRAEGEPSRVIIDFVKEKRNDWGITSFLEDEIDVLENRFFGVIVSNNNEEARALMPKPGRQTPEEFLKMISDRQGVLIYQPPDVNTPIKGAYKRETDSGGEFNVEGCAQRTFQLWGECGVVPVAEHARVFEFFNGKLKDLNPDLLVDCLARYEGQAYGKIKRVVAPSLLPANHELSPLRRIGVVAIQELDSKVIVVIDPEKAGIEAGAPKLVLVGEMNGNTLTFDGASEDLYFAPFNLLLNSGVLLGRIPVTQFALSRDEQALMRGLTNDYNREAKRLGVVRLQECVDPERDLQALVFLGKKVDSLSFSF